MEGPPCNVSPQLTSLLLNAVRPQEDVVTSIGFPSFSLPSFRGSSVSQPQAPSLLAGARDVYSSANFPDIKLKPGVVNTPVAGTLSHLPVTQAILEATQGPTQPSRSSTGRRRRAPSNPRAMPAPEPKHTPVAAASSHSASRRPARQRKQKVDPDFAYSRDEFPQADSHTQAQSSSPTATSTISSSQAARHGGPRERDANAQNTHHAASAATRASQQRGGGGGVVKKQQPQPQTQDDDDEVLILDNPPQSKKRKIKHEPREHIADPVEKFLVNFRKFLATFLQSIKMLSPGHSTAESLWEQICSYVSQLSRWKVLHKAPGDGLVALLKAAVALIKDAAALQVLTPCTLPEKSVISRSLRALDVALLALRIMTAPGVPRACISDDVVEAIVTLVTHHTNRTVLAQHETSLRSINPKSGKRKKGDAQFEATYWSTITPTVASISTKVISAFELLQLYIRREAIQEQQVYPLLHACFQSFHVEKVRHLQIAALHVISAVFLHCEEHRVEIRKSLVRAMLKGTGRRCFSVDLGSSRTSIHVTTALLLHLLQSVSALSLEPSQQHKLNAINEEASRSRRAEIFNRTLTEPHQTAARCTDEFVRAFLLAAFGRSEKDVHKEAFTAFIEDLIPLLFQPEWPAAELVLKNLVTIMHAYIVKKKSEKGFIAARSLCLETVGAIAVAVKTHLKKCEESPIVVSQKREDVNPHAQPGSKGEDASCICNRGAIGTELMLDCDECHRWFHGKCVGINIHKLPEQFICEDCHIRLEVRRQRELADTKVFKSQADRVGDLDRNSSNSGQQQGPDEDDEQKGAGSSSARKKGKSGGDAREVDATEVLRTLLLNFLTARITGESSIVQFARQFHIADMLSAPPEATDDSDKSSEVSDSDLSFFRRHWVPHPEEMHLDKAPTLSRDTIVRINRQLGKQRPLLRMFDSLVSIILYFLSEKQPTLRSRAMRALRALVTADSSVLQLKRVCKVVTQRSQDKSNSVREATVDLIGKYVLECDNPPKLYVAMLRARVMDSGLAVRKRAIKTLKELCLENPGHPQYTDICIQLVQRVNDSEETVHQLILDTVQQLWFSEDSAAIAKRVASDSKDVAALDELDPTQLSRRDVLKKTFTKDFAALADKLVSVVKNIGNTRWLVDLITRLLKREEKKGKTFQYRKVHRICEDFCICIVGLIENLDNGDDDDDDDDDADEQKDGRVSSQFAMFARIEPYVKTLEMFCQARPVFLVDHIYALQPYLKASPSSTEEMMVEGAILQHVLSIFRMCFPLAEDLQPSFTKHCEEDLRTIIQRKGAAVLKIAVPCLCILCERLMKDTDVLDQMLHQYVMSLNQYIEKPESLDAREVLLFVLRSLLAMGLMMQHHDFEESDAPLNGFTGRKTDVVFSLYSRYCKLSKPMLKQYAVQGVFFLFTRRPELLLQAQPILADAFHKDAEPRLSLTMLNSIRDFLDSEQKRDEFLRHKKEPGAMQDEDDDGDSDDERAKVSGIHSMSTSVRKDDKTTDAGILGGVIQQYLPAILNLMFSRDRSIRDASLRLIRLVLSHGFINPAWAVPHTMGLLVDEVSSTAEAALAEITNMETKHHSILRSRITQGILQSYRFLNLSLDNKFDPVGDAPTFLERTERFDRFYALFRAKATTRDPLVKLLCSMMDLEFCRKQAGDDAIVLFLYVVQLVGRLPYAFEEPFAIIRRAQGAIAQKGASTESHLNSLKSRLAKRGGCPAAQRPALMLEYRRTCEEGLMISALSMLCSYLKATYQLSDEKCETWTSSTRDKVIRSRDARPLDLKRLPYIRHHDELTREALAKAKHIPQLLKKQHEFFADQMEDVSSSLDFEAAAGLAAMTDDEDDVAEAAAAAADAAAEAGEAATDGHIDMTLAADIDPGYSSSSHKENDEPASQRRSRSPPPAAAAGQSHSNANANARGSKRVRSNPASRSNSVARADADDDSDAGGAPKKRGRKKKAGAKQAKAKPKNLRAKKARARKPRAALDDDVVIPPERRSRRKRMAVQRYTPEDNEDSDDDSSAASSRRGSGGASNGIVDPSVIPIDSSSVDDLGESDNDATFA